MSNDEHANPENDADGESHENVPCLCLNDMTQDVIEWDESKNMDLGQMFQSPQPPSSGFKCTNRYTGTRGCNATVTRKISNGNKSNTPLSTPSNNSSLFAGVKRQLDSLCHFHAKMNINTKKKNETKKENVIERNIDGISCALNRVNDNNITVDNIEAVYGFSASSSSSPNPLRQISKLENKKLLAKIELESHHIQTNSMCSATSLTQRHQRRRLGYPQEQQNECKSFMPVSKSFMPVSVAKTSATSSVVLQPQCTTTAIDDLPSILGKNTEPTREKKLAIERHDDFAELLEAITTPNLSSGPGQLSRVPLSPVNPNMLSILTATENSTERTQAGFCPSKNNARKILQPQQPEATTVTMMRKNRSYSQPEFDEIPTSALVEKVEMHIAHQYPPSEKTEKNESDHNTTGDHDRKCQKDEEDEFGEIEFSEDDLAKIDSLTQLISSRRISKRHVIELPTCQDNCIGNRDTIQTKTSEPVKDTNDSNVKRVDEKNHTEFTKEASDEFGDFPSDLDLAEIYAMVSTQSLITNEEQSARRAKVALQRQKSKFLEIPASSINESSTSCNSYKHKEESTEREDEDEFGSFLNDVDFSRMDALVATQCCRSKAVNPKTSKIDSMTADHLNEAKEVVIPILDETSPVLKTDDEFGNFPDDIDFNVLDQVVTQRMVVESSVTIDPGAAVRNQRINRHHFGKLSFMKFSRYKVLTVDTDQRNGTKILGVATWINSMVESDEVIQKILRDGKAKKSCCDIPGEEKSCIFTHAQDVDYPVDGLLHLCGEWSFTPVDPGDIIHICSLSGQYQTDATALPIVLHSFPPPGSDVDDLILVLHPDMLMSPSIISETSSCNRRAALKSKLGSTGISSKPAFVGTMRHGLFEACMKAAEFDSLFAQRVIKNLIREKAEMLIGCNMSESEAANEVLSVLPMIQRFAQEYTTFRKDIMMLSSLGKTVGGVACHPDIRLLAKGVHSVEENIVSTSLGLKGSIDAVLETESTIISHKHSRPSSTSALYNPSDVSPQQSLMCLELKTGHNQTVQNVHMAQLSLYTFMLQSRYGVHVELDNNLNTGSHSPRKTNKKGGAPGGILLYLNDKSQQICHVSPRMNEVKTLMSQRNIVASDSKRALRPRGITLTFEEANRSEDDEYLTAKLVPAPTANLPELKASSHSCKRCFSNRECMLYAASDSTADLESHRDLLAHFTGHLNEEDLAYFRKWDRLIDIEAESSNTKASTSWLINSRTREMEIGESISEMSFDTHLSYKVGNSHALVCFRRKNGLCSQSSFGSLNIARGSHVIVSIDGTLLHHFARGTPTEVEFQNRMYITKGCIDRIEEDKIFISTTFDEMNQMKLLIRRYQDNAQQSTKGNVSSDSLLFRLDKSTSSFGSGTLRWNLINFLTGDNTTTLKTECTELDRIRERRLAWLRDVVIRLKAPEFAEDPQPSLFHGIDLHIPGCNLLELSKEFHLLNGAQQIAVKKVMSGRDYTLIQGLPGTGKTSTLGFLARLLVARGRRVLITAYTHSAVDNIMSKLVDKGMGSRNSKSGMSALVRLGNRRPCHESVKPILHSELALELDNASENRSFDIEPSYGDVDHPSAASLKEVIATSRVLGISALSLPRSPLLQSEIFDVVIIDEAGQMNEPTALGALAAADSFVLVGDHKQLPPLVNSSIANTGGYGISMLKRLANQHPHAIAPLTMQYRMNAAICKISSESMYGGQLRCGNDKVASQILNLPGFPFLLPMPKIERSTAWLRTVVDPERPVIFVDTDNILLKRSDISQPNTREEKEFTALEGKVGGSIVNKTEAKLVWYILEAMQLCGHDLSEIGVISPFRAQIRVIEDNVAVKSWKKKGLELSTIDKYQGRDKSTIILSLVRSNRKLNAGRLLQDARRLNVAFTRAKCKLIVIGSYRTLSNGSSPLRTILNSMDTRKQRFKPSEKAIDCYNMM